MCVGVGGDNQKYVTQWGSPQRGGIMDYALLYFLSKHRHSLSRAC
jgi:hypothetical protein